MSNEKPAATTDEKRRAREPRDDGPNPMLEPAPERAREWATRFQNPTKQEVRVDLYNAQNRKRTFVWAPGATEGVPTEYKTATKNRAPQLVELDAEGNPVKIPGQRG